MLSSGRSRISAIAIATPLLAALLVATSAPSAGATAGGASPRERALKDSHNTAPSPLIDHHGEVLTSSTLVPIWWGTNFPTDEQSGIDLLLGGFNGSSYLAIANQYMRGATATTSYTTGSDLFDSSAPPSHAPSVAAIATEVASLVQHPNPNAIYLVYTSNFPKINYCAWHASAQVNGVTTQIAYLPNATDVAGCDPGDLYGANTFSEGTRSVADSTAHEFMESVTDPLPLTGWADKNGQEIGDKCNFVYGGPVTLSSGPTWQLQMEWSDAASGCVPGA